jgi:RNA polymerase sigma factor (sigma-70 family)
MPANPFTPLLRTIRQSLGLHAPGASPDALLLDRFVRAGDEEAFAALVERHGALVWGVCRWAAGDAHAAEDAFQATWIVLSRKARTLRDGGCLPGWLHRVAHRLALAARARPAEPLADAPAEAPGPADEAALNELCRAVDEEVSRLPEKYRLPVVLCFLQGRTHAEAAAELGWPVGTVAGRVARAKDLLHARLTRRGLAPAAWPLPLAAAGAFPPVAGKVTGGAASALASALLAGEAQRRWLVGGMILLLSCAGVVAGVAAYRAMMPVRSANDPIVSKEEKPAWKPPRLPIDDGKPSPAARIPRTRIRVDDGVALAPDGTLLAGSRDGRVRIFDVRTNEEVRALAGEGLGSAHALLFSPDGNWLAASGSIPSRNDGKIPGQRWVKVWNLASGELRTLTTLPGAWDTRLFPVGFGPAGETLVAAVEKEIHLWDVRSGKRLRSIQGGYGAMSPDGRTLATWDAAARATRLWEVPSGKELFNLGACGAPTFHPDSETVATVDTRAVVRLWDRKTGQPQATLDPCVVRCNVPHDQLEPRQLAGIRPAMISHTGDIMASSRLAWFSPDGEVLASTSGQGQGLLTHLWSVRGKKHLRQVRGVFSAFSADSKRFATLVNEEPARPPGSPSGGWNRRSNYPLRMWDIASGNSVFDIGGPGGSVLFTPDGKTILRGATLCDARTGREQGALTGYEGGGLAFTLDSKTLVSVSGQKATLWNVVKVEKQDAIGKATVSKDGRVVTSEKGVSIKLSSPLNLSLYPSARESEDADAPRIARVIKGDPQAPPPGYEPRKLVVSPDGGLRVELVSPGDKDRHGVLGTRAGEETLAIVGRVKEEGRHVSGPEGQYRGVVAAAFSPDGKYLALGRSDGTVLLWDISPAK